MNVQYITCPAAKLDTITVVDGQLIAINDADAYYYDMGSVRHKVIAVATTAGLGIVKPDGTSITIDNDGTIHSTGTGTFYGVCTTAANQPTKAVTISDSLYALRAGVIIGVKFTYTNSYSAEIGSPVQLNVNSGGAKNIYYGDSSNPEGTNPKAFGTADCFTYYMYDGTNWVYVSDTTIDSEDNTKHFVLQNETLVFENLEATISDARISASTVGVVYFNPATLSAAEAAQLTITTGSGAMTFTAANEPSSNLVCTVVCDNP